MRGTLRRRRARRAAVMQRFSAWIGSVRQAVAGWGQQVQDYWSGYFQRGEPEQEAPPAPQQGAASPGMEPQL